MFLLIYLAINTVEIGLKRRVRAGVKVYNKAKV